MLHPQLWPDTAAIDQHNHLTIGGYDTVALVGAYGTPLYLLDEATFRAGCRAYRRAFQRRYRGPSAIHYASKALLNLAVAQIVAEEGLGLDVVSGGEQHVALQAGFPAERMHMHGNAKSRVELEQALMAGVGRVVVDNLDELELLSRLVERRSAPAAIMLRLSPGIAVDTHSYIETGSAESKFGLPLDALDAAAARIRATSGLRLAGLHVHLGSQFFDYAPIQRAISVLLDCVVQLRDQHDIIVDEVSPGGGLGVPYTVEQSAPDLDAYAAAVGDALEVGCAARGLPPLRLVIEPGRSLVARAGVALYTVVATKQLPAQDEGRRPAGTRKDEASSLSSVKLSLEHAPSSSAVGRSLAVRYLHVDGGMADNIRPALYGARYTALLANRAADAADEIVHVAGRFCESGDVLLRSIALPRAATGDLLAVAVAGAYTLSMSSSYNLVPRPPLLLIGGAHARLIQRGETYADLLARDVPL
jgi:diaminopimelate decarboxylase